MLGEGTLLRGLVATALLGVAVMTLAGCVRDHRGPGWYHYGHRWHHRPPPAGVVVD